MSSNPGNTNPMSSTAEHGEKSNTADNPNLMTSSSDNVDKSADCGEKFRTYDSPNPISSSSEV